jgi:energy-coupling factor transporter transmembrane protein EcfT
MLQVVGIASVIFSLAFIIIGIFYPVFFLACGIGLILSIIQLKTKKTKTAIMGFIFGAIGLMVFLVMYFIMGTSVFSITRINLDLGCDNLKSSFQIDNKTCIDENGKIFLWIWAGDYNKNFYSMNVHIRSEKFVRGFDSSRFSKENLVQFAIHNKNFSGAEELYLEPIANFNGKNKVCGIADIINKIPAC